jgi:hypothetical protein
LTIDLAYSYCLNLSQEEKLKIDEEVLKNQFYIKILLYRTILVPIIGIIIIGPICSSSRMQNLCD